MTREEMIVKLDTVAESLRIVATLVRGNTLQLDAWAIKELEEAVRQLMEVVTEWVKI